MSNVYDAIVIGAGPAGSTAAAELASLGFSVLLLEAKPLPRDKPCGGGLTPRAWRRLTVPIDDLVLSRATSVQLRCGPRFSASVRARETAIWMVRRREFDQRLVEGAVQRGAVLHDGEPTVSMEPGQPVRVVTSQGAYTGRVLVGADGAESRVARWLGMPRPARWMVGLETEVGAVGNPLRGEAVVDLAIPHGYAWAFPKGSAYNIGVGTFSPSNARDLKRLLREFGDSLALPLAGSPPPVGHRIPCAPPRGPLHSGNALVVGDAAGVADPLFAEGISYSLLSGRLAADAAADYLRGDRPDLSGYTAAMRSTLAADMRLLGLTASVVHRFPEACVRFLAASPWLQSLLERTIAGEVSLLTPPAIGHNPPAERA